MALIPPSPVGSPFTSYTWADWYEKVRRAINESTTISWSQITSFDSGPPLPVAFGGTGTTTPALVAGTNVSITGAWPNQTINSTGGLAAIANLKILANISGGAAVPIANTVSAVLDATLGSTQGQLITRNASTWTVLNPGTAGFALVSGGAGVDLSYATFPSILPAGRLTLTTGVPVTTSDVTGAGTIYYTPYKGNQIQLWDGTGWTAYTFTEKTLALGTLTASLPYDVFARQVAGVLTLDSLAWTNTTTRATAVTLQDGRYCKSGDKTRLYLGTFYTTSTTTTEDSGGGTVTNVGGKRFLWNMYNREPRPSGVIDTTSSWTYSTNTWRQARATTGNRCEFVIGDPTWVEVRMYSLCANSAGANFAVGVGLDSTTVNSAQMMGGGIGPSSTVQISAFYDAFLSVGYHALNWLEIGNGTATQTWYGQPLTYFQSGMRAVVWA